MLDGKRAIAEGPPVYWSKVRGTRLTLLRVGGLLEESSRIGLPLGLARPRQSAPTTGSLPPWRDR